MSTLIKSSGLALFSRGDWGINEDCLQPPDYRQSLPETRGHQGNNLRDTDVVWTRCSFPQQGGGGNGFFSLDSAHQFWEWNFPPSGCHVRKIISGVVVNASGVPVAGVTVDLFNTLTGLQVDTQISASDGSFTCGDPNAVNCFAVADIAGSPETAGTTIQSLTGT